ncbi:DUF819 domain-containing protein [Chloropicon primus]|nr:DUF819 domain-containing protein [Chloropicon primus]UPQ97231.1 DUF819 domain-containing protein [Chloropicon primus]|eukprot:QDZ18016.1 DUF819 domain-containing protein [Chloropicon primus]
MLTPRRPPPLGGAKPRRPSSRLVAAGGLTSGWTCWTALSASVFFSQVVDNYKLGKLLSPPAVTMLISMVFGALGVLPNGGQEFEFIWTWIMPLATCLYLLPLDLRQLRNFPQIFLAFVIGAFGTVVGTVAGYFVMRGGVSWKAASSMCASCVGGSLNFAAVSRALGLSQVDSSAALASDSFGMMLYLMVLMAIPVKAAAAAEGARGLASSSVKGAKPEVTSKSLLFSLTAASLSCFLGDSIANWLCMPAWSLAFISLVAPLVGLGTASVLSLLPKQSEAKPNPTVTQDEVFAGSFRLGSVLMLFFFATIGAKANFADMLHASPGIFCLLAVIIAIHLGLSMLLGRLLRVPLRVILIASNANVGGPATACAMAATKGWHDLLQPALLVGSFGYAVGSVIGLAVSQVLKLM